MKKVTAPLNEYRRHRHASWATKRQARWRRDCITWRSRPRAPIRLSAILVVSPYNIIFKQSETEAFVWVTDLKSGQVARSVPVRIYDADGDVMAEGPTDADGVFKATLRSSRHVAGHVRVHRR